MSIAEELVFKISGARPPARLLFVDDDPHDRDLFAEYCRDFNARLSFAGDYAGALRVLETLGEFALVLIDIVLPGGRDGVGLYAEIAHRWPAQRVCLVTGAPSIDGVVDRARAIGAARVIRKPVDFISSRFLDEVFAQNGILKINP